MGDAILSVSFDPKDSRKLLITRASLDPRCALLDLTTGQPIVQFNGHDNSVYSGVLSPDGRVAASAGGNQNEVFLWAPETGQSIARLAGKGRQQYNAGWRRQDLSIAWSAHRPPNLVENERLDRPLNLPDLDFDDPRDDPSPSRGRVRFVETIRDGKSYVTPQLGYAAAAFVLPQAAERVNCCTRLPDGRLVVGSTFGGMYLFDPRTGGLLKEYRGHTSELHSLSVSSSGK